ncbi:multicopper oxidase family protein [Streptosporangium sp. NPDC051022]|uniref:multicopper oxidase family protein n=1 Tax=Streptosporangium sp. NPDC051022 TaxID=3155752 RepID=UPI00342EE15D
MLNRRNFLVLSGLTAGGAVVTPALLRTSTVAGQADPPHHSQHPGGGSGGAVASVAVAPFSVRMPLLPTLRPVRSTRTTDIYEIAIQPANMNILPGLNTPGLTYGGGFVGPTIRTRTGRQVAVTYRNLLDMPANVHLHGGHVPASSDGHPMDLIQPGQARLYEYPNTQQGATLWYHDHAHHMEAEHVYRGLHGFYVIEDEDERHLRLPDGNHDVPIMIRDAQFDDTGALVYGNPALRTTILVNGRPQPYFPVDARKYRFRLLNASNEGTFRLNLGNAGMTQIASDGGLLSAPVPRDEIALSAGERVEIVIDFSRYPVGTQLVLADGTRGPVLRFDVVRRADDRSRLPDVLRPLPPLPPATNQRDVVFSFDLTGPAPVGLINGKPYDPARDDFRIKRGTTEIWRVTNADTEFGFMHNFHMHLAQFRVLDRDGKPPTLDDAGRKDTVFVAPGSTVRVQATFDTYLGRYAYHCHFLEHSSVGMMAQMEIIP